MANIVEFLKIDKATDWIKSKFSNENEIARFKSNIVAISNSNDLLQKADPRTIMTACYQGVLLNLPMEKQFGYAYVVPYNTKITRIINGREVQEWVNQAQFQMGYKGYIQLAWRSGQYLDIAVTDVRVGELIDYDRLEQLKFNWIQDDDEREKLPIIGYVAYFKLINGAKKYLYMKWQQMENHFMKYSKTYAKNKSFYIATFDEMAYKTVLTSLLKNEVLCQLKCKKHINQTKQLLQLMMKKFILIMILLSPKIRGKWAMNLYQKLNTPSYTEIADTNDNVVKEEDISNVVPIVNNNDEKWATW